jgi:alkanesulfonate monooxygenase SsuD/methylene tetrahydromethanopterin reductase-like flavin-dependent oxidoreductase (luciferase family)
MLELGVYHNGASDLPKRISPDGVVVNDGTLADSHVSFQRALTAQVRQGILADRLGFNYWFMSEHHFQPEGPEFSPNPLLVETAIAAQTRQLRLGQQANIITWWEPIRLAEQAAMLDVISGGRLEFGIGRGYQPREAEVFGHRLGATIQDQERNRAYFHEAYDIILKAWTQPSFSYRGQFFSIPPSWTKWHHKQTIAYFSDPRVGRRVDDVLHVGPPDLYSTGSPVMASTTTLKEISVFPQPVQKPYPQVWEPVTSERSIKWCAANGVNCFTIPEPTSRLKRNVETYYEALEKEGWPDRLNRGKFKYGWDAEKKRGFAFCRSVHLVLPGMDRDREWQRVKMAMELEWDYYGPFGFAAVLADADEPMYDLSMKVTAELLAQKEVLLFGTPDEVGEKILRVRDKVGYEDVSFTAWFELGGFTTEEIEEQMQHFVEDVAPGLRQACGGQLQNPEVSVGLVPQTAVMA